ncbi:NADP-dependent 3-hydroxy acid dehydrogenase YdfG [Alkalibacterium putridalgicola]|uniref:NADP-dependent 3-hydroxy acid dehydrogenase YdfG n=1 Tax=Alkalibacterium putridalgicola TaxID=426703 RepID=A0A1H7VK39_9LACT|nr:SDR family oxidoreductase [Alkalibacterium putridalgicola]GEK89407.1 putative oxidoreductase YxnA [Alkalibacterium putridalgicola]SEM09593.1 NADP-dependent 3-hydroxy acid dehydrogenase YdfG [Alkalibacterium putridalgicola]
MQHELTDRKPLDSLSLKLKKLKDQVIVITGATSGIGLVTARMAADKGAKLVLGGREKAALETLTDELSEKTEVVYLEMDVSKEEEVKQLAEKAVETFGGFDTWVNNAAVAIYGHLTDVPIVDARELFEINYWGTVYGSLAAIDHFREKETAGALINMGSVLGNRTFPIQGTYSSSKFAVHSFTDALRMEAEKEHLPVVVTQIHPARIDTPYAEHAASYIDKAPSHDGMMYPPESVAESILYTAEHPVRDMYVGGQSKMISLMGALMPRFTDRYLEKSIYDTNYDESKDAESPLQSSLYGEGEQLKERGGNNIGWTRKGSLLVKVKKHPLLFLIPIMIIGVTSLSFLLFSGNNKSKAQKLKEAYRMKKTKMMFKHPKKAWKYGKMKRKIRHLSH